LQSRSRIRGDLEGQRRISLVALPVFIDESADPTPPARSGEILAT
jgi:hypothetical protein